MTTEIERTQLEQNMIDAITAYVVAEDQSGNTTRIKSVQVLAVTDNGDLPAGERVVYANGESCRSMLLLAAPVYGAIGASDPPMLMARGTIPFTE